MTTTEVEMLIEQARDGRSDLERKLAASVLMVAGVVPFPEAKAEGRTMQLLTDSRLKAARACQRLHCLRYVLGYSPVVKAETLVFGTLMHAVLEPWWRAPKAERLERALEALAQAEAEPFDRVKVEALITGYHHRWIDEPFEALAVETEFSAPLRNPATGRPSQVWTMAGKIDVVVRDLRDGRQLLVEHKTASGDISPGSEYWRRLRMNGQISHYYEGARALGYDVAGCLYDVIGKPGLRPLKATPLEDRKFTKKTGELYANQRLDDETAEEFRARVMEDIATDPSKYFQRGEVVRLEGELEDALFDTWQLGQQIHESTKAGRHPRNPEACTSYGRTCEFFDVCTGVASLEDPHRFARSEKLHPELSDALTSAFSSPVEGEK